MPSYKSDKSGHQVAALPLRWSATDAMETLLVTSRETQRWIIPKGWPMKGLPDHRAAEIEASEEAGVEGVVLRKPIGWYTYWKRTDAEFRLARVDVFVLKVQRQLGDWKEMGQRQSRWTGIEEAAALVLEPELSTLMARLPSRKRVMAFLAKH